VFQILKKINALISDKVDYPLPVKRALALQVTLSYPIRGDDSFSKWANHSANSLLDRVCEIYSKYFLEEIDYAQIRTVELGSHDIRAAVAEIGELITDLSPDEIRSFEEYINASKLLIDCMAIDSIASKAMKKKIINSFLIEEIASSF